ncbi:MAG: electron transport complex subunit RsxE, partial [Candidatus Glassbacteria bacterium]
LAATFVLLGSNLVISLLRKAIPNKIRIPAFIVVIATFVTIVDLVMHAYTPELHRALGIFIPLIVVNCIILGRAEAFASKYGVGYSLLDALGMGLGFTIVLCVIGSVRELLGSGSILGLTVAPASFRPVLIFILPPGGFIALAMLLAGFNFMDARRASK